MEYINNIWKLQAHRLKSSPTDQRRYPDGAKYNLSMLTRGLAVAFSPNPDASKRRLTLTSSPCFVHSAKLKLRFRIARRRIKHSHAIVTSD